MNSEITKIMVVGETGNGKSTLCNYILGYKEKKFKESKESKSCTFEVDGCIGAENTKFSDIFMIDTPGLSDSNGRDQIIIDKIRKSLKEKYCCGIKTIIIVQNVNNVRLSAESQRQIYLYCKMFPIPDFWYHVGIAFTFCYEFCPQKQYEKFKQNKETDFIPDFRDKVQKITDEINSGLPPEKQMKIPGIFQMYFLDCGEVDPPFNHDRTDEQISKLVYWSKNQEFIDFDKNDLEGKISCDYKSKEYIGDENDLDEERISNTKIKYIIIGFNNETRFEIDNKYYKTEIYFIKLEITETTETKEEKLNDDDYNLKGKKKVITITKKFCRKIKLDENEELLEEIEPKKEISNSQNEAVLNSEIVKREPEYKTEIQKDEPKIEYRHSATEVQEYFNEVRNLSTGEKILFIGFNVLHFISGLGHLIAYIVSKLQGKQVWKIVSRKYREVEMKREIKTTDVGNIIKSNWEFYREIRSWTEYNEPVRID